VRWWKRSADASVPRDDRAPQARPRPFLGDILTLVTGSGLAQALSFLAAPLLARLYSPDQVGLLSVYAFAVAVPSAVVCWSYEAAIMLPRDEGEARDVTILALVLASAMSLLFVLPALAARPVARALGAPALAPWLGLIPLNLLALGLYQALSYWLNRKGDFPALALSRIAQSGVTAGAQVGLGAVGVVPAGLVTGQALGQAAAAGVLWTRAARAGAALGSRPLSVPVLRRTLVRYRRFPLYTSWGTLMGSAAFQVVPVILSRQFGPAQAGLYFFGFRLISAGVQLLVTSITQVFFQRASARHGAGEPLGPLVELVAGRLLLLSALGLVVSVPLARPLFGLVFGSQWAAAGDFMAIMMPMFCAQLVASPVSSVLFVTEQQHVGSILQALLLASTVGTLLLADRLHSPATATLAYYCAGQVTVYAAYLLFVLRACGGSPLGVLRSTVRPSTRG